MKLLFIVKGELDDLLFFIAFGINYLMFSSINLLSPTLIS